MKRLSTILLAGLIGLAPPAAQAHEFWIAPEAYMVEPGAPIRANLRVGEMFEGSSYAYLPRNFVRFDLVCNGDSAPVEGRPGDRPALVATHDEATLCVVVHQTRDYELTYRDWETFASFVTHKDFAWALEEHAARGLAREGFRERYSRYAKSLVAVGNGAGADARMGLLVEIVAEANPYTDDLSTGLPLRVFYGDAPRGNAQVEIFSRAPDGEVSAQLLRTDAEGRLDLPVAPGHEYLVDSVVMRPVQAEAEGDPVWESLWASLTFRVPSR